MARRSDEELVGSTRNSARFFVENPHISWVLLAAVIGWGVFGFVQMPKRKDPTIPVRIATAVTPWPGISATRVEQLVTRAVEQKIAENSAIHPPEPGKFGIKSLSLPGISVVQIQLDESVSDPQQVFSDIELRLDALNPDLPGGAGPVQFDSGFGDTAALMLTVASPPASDVEVALRADSIARAIERARSTVPVAGREGRVAVLSALPWSLPPPLRRRAAEAWLEEFSRDAFGRHLRQLVGPGFVGVDLESVADDAELLARAQRTEATHLGDTGFHLDFWDPIVVRDPNEIGAELGRVRGPRYTYQQLNDFTDLMSRRLNVVSQVSKVSRSGVLDEWLTLLYSQEELAATGLQPSSLQQILAARNVTLPGGVFDTGDSQILVDATSELAAGEVGNVLVTTSDSGSPVYLRSLVDVVPGYESPPRFLNFYTWRDADGSWLRSPSITVAVYMRAGEQVADFGASVQSALEELEARLPEDLVIARTSDQPRQVRENIDLFLEALFEALALVGVVALLGFREWRSALLVMLSIPTTLALTFGMIFSLGIDLQQVSLASLIIALGLLVDDPVVAGDAIKTELAAGRSSGIVAWLGPTKLAQAILFATITNVAAYLPFLMLSGNSGDFLYSLPVVMACALVASRVVSMTFVPLLGSVLVPPTGSPPPLEERRSRGLSGTYHRIGGLCIDHRKKVMAASLLLLGLGGYVKTRLPNAFFPEDVQYLSYIDLWLRNDAPLSATDAAARQAEGIVRDVAAAQEKERGDGRPILKSVTTFEGGGAPRFWFTVTPQLHQQNYAQLVVELYDKDDTPRLIGPLQRALSEGVPGAWIDARQLQTNPVRYPVRVFVSGRAAVNPEEEQADVHGLRRLATEVGHVLRRSPLAERVRDDWGPEDLVVRLAVDADRAALAGVSNQDVAVSAVTGLSGSQVGTLDRGDEQIPIVARLRPSERAQVSDLKNLYVLSSENTGKVPLGQVASLSYALETERIRRRDHFRTIGVIAFPRVGALPSQVMDVANRGLTEIAQRLPPGYALTIAGEQAKQRHGFRELGKVLAVTVAAIFLALTIQFRNAVKPLIVFAAVPYGVVGALLALAALGAPFSYMAFLGIVSLVGVIVSHVILLFDFIEVMRERGEPLREALLDAGLVRLRPVAITVGATVLALVPLAIHGGPLWQPLCYAQIGGLLVASFVTLLLVPVIYSIFVLDLRVVKWEE
jgi:multidrug efflux pump subunit AcrB